jgi:CRP/FNR family transcriptional regulator, anaerobic regulatory protein
MPAIISMKTNEVKNNIVPLRAAKVARCVRQSTLADVCQLLQYDISFSHTMLDTLFQHRRFKSGEMVCGAGQAFEALYVVNAGFLKTVMPDNEGNDRVISFPMKGDLLGSDGICTDRHASETIALSDSDLIVIPFKQLLSIGHACQEMDHLIYRVVSRQTVQENLNFVTFGALRSDARVARFLAIEADRHAALKFSAHSLRLRMTRRDIGSYLGLTLETVSRSISALASAGIITVAQREINILQPHNLRCLVEGKSTNFHKSQAI